MHVYLLINNTIIILVSIKAAVVYFFPLFSSGIVMIINAVVLIICIVFITLDEICDPRLGIQIIVGILFCSLAAAAFSAWSSAPQLSVSAEMRSTVPCGNSPSC